MALPHGLLPSDLLNLRSVEMRNTVTVVLIGMMWVVAVGNLAAQIAGSTTTGVTVEELKTIARG
jgi:sporulation protein YlmC with PRC-barrel domain